jgi:small subunit ribosomal protein S4
MARYTDSVCRLCRREGTKLFLKGERCYSEKCAVERRQYAPGQHGQARKSKFSEYGTQLREKQKVKRIYGILENQFRRYFHMASSKKGVTGEVLLQLLERRMDNMVYRMGFAASRAEARQLVLHNHFTVNGKKVTIPSYLVRAGDAITLRPRSQKNAKIIANLDSAESRGVPGWVELSKETFTAKVKAIPARNEITMPIQEQLIVELYSR